MLEAGRSGNGESSEPTATVLIHGSSGHLESFIRSIPYLAPVGRTIVFDLPWHGYSGYPDRPYDVYDYANHLAALIEQLGLESVTLVGQSLGGAIAARSTVDKLFQVEKLVLIGTVAPNVIPDGPPGDSMRAGMPDRSFEAIKTRLEFAMMARGPEMDEYIECRYLAYQLGDWESRLEAFTFYETEVGRRRSLLTDEEWKSIGCPTLLVWGAEDKVTPPSVGERLEELISGSRLYVFEKCGHNPQFELPDEVNPKIADFVGKP